MTVRTPIVLEGIVRNLDKLPLEFPASKIRCDRCNGVVFVNEETIKQRFDYHNVYDKYREAVSRPCFQCGISFLKVSDFQVVSWPVFHGFVDSRAVKARIRPVRAVLDKFNKYPRLLHGIEMEFARSPKNHCFDSVQKLIILKFNKLSNRKSEQVQQVIELMLHFLIHQQQDVEQKWSKRLASPCVDLVFENEVNDFVELHLEESIDLYYKVEEEIGPGWP